MCYDGFLSVVSFFFYCVVVSSACVLVVFSLWLVLYCVMVSSECVMVVFLSVVSFLLCSGFF